MSMKAKLTILTMFLIIIFVTPLTASAESRAYNAITTRLDNGLELVMIENSSVPLISVFTVIKAGSATESYDQNGMTHMLEHMLFNGTENRTQEEIYDDMDLIGAYNNAYTRKDYTCFILTAPAKNIDKALEVQSDMILHSTFDPVKVEKEIGIITEEIRRDIGSSYYAVNANFENWIYSGTPYEKTILGTVEGINTMSADDIKEYWSSYYVPNNMMIVAIGDFKTKEFHDLIDKYYGDALPQQVNTPADYPLNEIHQIEHRTDYIPDAQHSIKVVMNAPKPCSDAGIALDLLIGIMDQEINDYLSEKSPDHPIKVSVDIQDYRIGSILIFSASVPDAISDSEAEKLIIDAIRSVSENKTSEESLNAAQIRSVASDIKMQENTMYFGMFTIGDSVNMGWENVESRRSKIESLTPWDLDLIRSLYFKDPIYMAYITKPLPESASADVASTTEWVHEVLPNGLEVAIKRNDASEVFGMHFLVKNRCYLEPDGKDGMVDLLHRLIKSGTDEMTEQELALKMDSLGMDMKTNDYSFIPFDDYYLDPEYSYIRVNGLDRFSMENIDLVYDMIKNMKITEDAISGARKGMIMSLAPQAMNSSTIAKKEFKKLLLGDSKVTRSILGNMMTLNSITVDEMAQFKEMYFAPDNMILSIVTSEDTDKIMEKIKETFGTMQAQGAESNFPDPEYLPINEDEIVKEVGGSQSYIIYSFTVDNIPEEDKIPLQALGSIISAEVAFDLRETQGLAYSIGASFNVDKDSGYFYLAMGTGPMNIDTAKTGIINVLDKCKTMEITEHKLGVAINSKAAQLMRYRVTRENQAYYIGYYLFEGMDMKRDPTDDWYKTDLDDVLRVRDKYFKPENGFFIIAK